MDLYDKIRKVEALIEKTSSDGERRAAEEAKQRLIGKINEIPVEYQISLRSRWEKRLFMAICKKNGLDTYRYYRQKHTTAMVRVSPTFMDKVVWPEYHQYAEILQEMVNEILYDLIDKVHHGDAQETVIAGAISEAS